VSAFEAAVFDMDGVLIDSEPYWRASEIEVFATLGLKLTEADCAATMGRRIDEVVAHWYTLHPWDGPGLDEVAARVVAGVIRRIRDSGRALPGAERAIALLRSRGLRLALASSSQHVVIAATLERLGLEGAFQAVVSAEDVATGKPAPDVFVAAAAALGTKPVRCLAIEDSPNGVAAARAAGMTCLAVARDHVAPAELAAADAVVSSLEELTPGLLERLERSGAGPQG
jgi:sugar-phosphatase